MFKFFLEKPDVISEKPCWVIIHNGYLYIHENIFGVLYQFVFEHNHDKHIVG